MTEVRLVTFEGNAIAIAQKVLALYRNKYSKHTFTQPQLLAILCLMHYEDWNFREIEIRLQEHPIELRMAFERHLSANVEQLSHQKIQSAKSYRDYFLWVKRKLSTRDPGCSLSTYAMRAVISRACL